MLDQPKLPHELVLAGTSVAYQLPLEAGTLAHRAKVQWPEDQRLIQVPANRRDPYYIPACRPGSEPHAAVSAGYADSFGAVACTEPGLLAAGR
jgi:hypothetical protein